VDWLAGWLREIIFIVLIAVFIDLLLPNRAMERYVRFVVSLLILLTLISPIMRFFSADAKDQLEAAFSTSWDGLESHSQVQSTEAILQQGEKLREKQESEALAWAGEEAARQMKQQIERSTGQQVERVTVKLKTKPTDKSGAGGVAPLAAEPVISAVEVVMAQVKSEEQIAKAGEAGRGPGVSIAPVEKIKISVNTSDSGKTKDAEEESEAQNQAVMAGTLEEPMGENGSGGEGKTVASDAEPAADRLVSQIEDLLQENWGVDREAITVLRAEHLND
jgi:stage III sporulation protein AF